MGGERCGRRWSAAGSRESSRASAAALTASHTFAHPPWPQSPPEFLPRPPTPAEEQARRLEGRQGVVSRLPTRASMAALQRSTAAPNCQPASGLTARAIVAPVSRRRCVLSATSAAAGWEGSSGTGAASTSSGCAGAGCAGGGAGTGGGTTGWGTAGSAAGVAAKTAARAALIAADIISEGTRSAGGEERAGQEGADTRRVGWNGAGMGELRACVLHAGSHLPCPAALPTCAGVGAGRRARHGHTCVAGHVGSCSTGAGGQHMRGERQLGSRRRPSACRRPSLARRPPHLRPTAGAAARPG